MASIFSLSLTERVRIARTIGKFVDNVNRCTPQELLIAAEKAAAGFPSEWVVFYLLGDLYQSEGRYAASLRACRQCVDIRPNEIRSVYALATAYNLLTRAEWPTPHEPGALAALDELARTLGDRFDSVLSQAGLAQAEMVVETAATQAIRWFERALALKPDPRSRAQIEADLLTLYRRFPKLRR